VDISRREAKVLQNYNTKTKNLRKMIILTDKINWKLVMIGLVRRRMDNQIL